MTITCVTGSLEPGKDGVGDYARCLAVEAARRGVVCRLIALADRHVTAPTVDDSEPQVEIMRLPSSMPWPARIRAAALRSANSDWVSLQFVPYSFHKRGLTGALVDALPALVGDAQLHVMFHELWIDGHASLSRRLISAGQRRSILALCRHPQAIVQTSNATYQQALREHGVNAGLLPLFGSIPIAGSDAAPWLSRLLDDAGCDALSGRRADWWLFALFGSLHPVWPSQPLLAELESAAAVAGKKIALIAAGRLGPGEQLWREMSAASAGRIPMVRLGEQSAERISTVLQAVDFGIATTPLALIGKSATAAAMFDHGLPVIVNREDGRWPAPPIADPREAALTIRLGDGFADRLRASRRLPARWRLPEIATQWLETLRAATVHAI
ncbi:unnamed protein product [uncultured bacterium]|nr:unnamed protein product [uncultured bacterium]